MAYTKKILGDTGEDLAVSFLKRQGYKIFQQNYRTNIGEIDIVADDGKVLCFIEVKTRKTLYFGSPFEAVSRAKQRKISQVACCYLDQNNKWGSEIRFDVVAVTFTKEGDPQVDLIKHAFESHI